MNNIAPFVFVTMANYTIPKAWKHFKNGVISDKELDYLIQKLKPVEEVLSNLGEEFQIVAKEFSFQFHKLEMMQLVRQSHKRDKGLFTFKKGEEPDNM